MQEIPRLHITIVFCDPEQSTDDLERITQSLFQEMSSLDEVERVERIRESAPPEVKSGGEDLGKWLVGLLTTELSFPNITPVLKFIFARLSGKEITLRATTNGKSIELKANGASKEEVLEIIQELKEFAKGG